MRYDYNESSGEFAIDISTTDNVNEFRITSIKTPNDPFQAVNPVSNRIQITADDILDDTWTAINNAHTVQVDHHVLNNLLVYDITMNPSSIFESWAIPVAMNRVVGRGSSTRAWVVFDLFRHQLILRNQPLIEFHGFIRHYMRPNVFSVISSHAQTYYDHNSRFRDGEVLDPTGGDTWLIQELDFVNLRLLRIIR